MKIERDEAAFEGGVRGGLTLGSPIAIGIANRDFASWDAVMGPLEVDAEAARGRRLTRPRPGHADLAGAMKFGATDLRDVLERASARESAARVAAGAVCKLLLREAGVEIGSGVLSLGPVADARSPRSFDSVARVRQDSPLRAVDGDLEEKMVAAVDEAKYARRHARRLDPRGRHAGCRPVSAPTRRGTGASTAASRRRSSRCRPSRRSSSAPRSTRRADTARTRTTRSSAAPRERFEGAPTAPAASRPA